MQAYSIFGILRIKVKILFITYGFMWILLWIRVFEFVMRSVCACLIQNYDALIQYCHGFAHLLYCSIFCRMRFVLSVKHSPRLVGS